ncbi:hypothetical protein GGI21_001174 [Coemansia aciculifera]|nr:hypothetical protein GGI21_001174 [Coemansia aciculifera]
MDCYTPKPRPHSLNTLSSVSCRLSIVTLDQEYQEYSYKKNAQVAVRPSAVRGLMKLFRGKVKYSVGQVIASPSLILQGNRDISRGTAQMNVSRCHKQRKRSEMQSNCDTVSKRLLRKSVISTSGPASGSESSSSTDTTATATATATTTDRLRAYWRLPKRDKPASENSVLAKDSGQLERPLSVIEMAVAAETAAEMELAETSGLLFTIRA